MVDRVTWRMAVAASVLVCFGVVIWVAQVVEDEVRTVPPSTSDDLLVIEGVTILPMTDGVDRWHDHSVLVAGQRIAEIGPTAQLRPPASAHVVDGRGRFLIPGLADMHVHVDHPSELELYPAHGVTTVFNLRGLDKHLAWRDDESDEAAFHPTLLTTGDYMDGHPPFMRPMMSFASADEAAAAVVEQQRAGFDAIKVYSRLSAEQIAAVGRAARAAGLPVVGHGSGNYPLDELVRWQSNIAHGEEVIRWYWDPERPDESLREIVEILREADTTVTANLNFSRSLIRQHQALETLLARPEAQTLHPAIFQPFRRANNRYARRDEAWLGRVRRGFEVQKQLIRQLTEAGVVVLAGTDASTAGVYPGVSLSEELIEMVGAGLTPHQALRTATRHPGDFVARHLPASAELPFGRVQVGYRADLVLLSRDPTIDIGHVTAVDGVVLRGRWVDRLQWRQRLDRLAESFEPIRSVVRELEQHIVQGRIEDARALFDATRDQHPDAVLFSQYVPFFVGYGFLYGEDGFHPDRRRLEVALGIYQMYAETYPEFHSAHLMLAEAHRALGESEAALAAAQWALSLHPRHPEAREMIDALDSDGVGPR
ncbi:MAG: amidohydrolase family protein [Acidobacteriota bacterium]